MYKSTIRRRAARRGLLLGASAIAIIAAGDLGFAQDQSVPPAPAPTTPAAPTTPPANSPATPSAPAAPPSRHRRHQQFREITVTAPKPPLPPPRELPHDLPQRPRREARRHTPTQPTAQQTAATAARPIQPAEFKHSTSGGRPSIRPPAPRPNQDPAGHREPAAGQQRQHQRPRFAVSRRLSGLHLVRRFSCPQRARQRAIPHQRDSASRRRFRLLADSSKPASSRA